MAVIKEFNLRRHFKTKHQDKLKNLSAEQKQKQKKVEELKKNLTSQHTAVKASFIVAEEIAKSAWPFTEGEFLERCIMKVCESLSSFFYRMAQEQRKLNVCIL